MNFRRLVLSKYIIAQTGPYAGKDYPPAQWASAMKNLKAMGREDIAKQLMDYWNGFLEKYPQYKGKHFGSVQTHYSNSIKKHLFGGKPYEQWLADQQEISPVQQKAAKEAHKIEFSKGTPAIAIPPKNETAEDWTEAKAETQKQLLAARSQFASVFEYIAQIEKEAADLQRKIEQYSTQKTKSGELSAYAKRIPKWKATLEVYTKQIAMVKEEAANAKDTFDAAEKKYESSHVATVKYEEKVQEAALDMTHVLEEIMKIPDLKRRAALLKQANDTLEKLKQEKGKAEGSILIEADIGDRFSGLLDKLKEGFKAFKSWLSKLNKSVDKLDELASISL